MARQPETPQLVPAFTCCGEHVELTEEPLDPAVLEAIDRAIWCQFIFPPAVVKK
jgi:hypothetical protein